VNCSRGEALGRENSKHNENQHDHDLGPEKRRFRLRGRQSLERGNLHEKLGDQNKNFEIKSNDGADDIRATLRSRQTSSLAAVLALRTRIALLKIVYYFRQEPRLPLRLLLALGAGANLRGIVDPVLDQAPRCGVIVFSWASCVKPKKRVSSQLSARSPAGALSSLMDSSLLPLSRAGCFRFAL